VHIIGVVGDSILDLDDTIAQAAGSKQNLVGEHFKKEAAWSTVSG